MTVAALLADPTRSLILDELLGGLALPAGALAARVGVAPSTVSGHLAKLEAAGLVTVERRGRCREARLAGPAVAEALEALGRLSDGDGRRPVGLRAVNRQNALRHARSCYDHLAGSVGVALADALLERGSLIERDGEFAVPEDRHADYAIRFGIDVAVVSARRRPLVRACTDWTERRSHVAGALGAALLAAMLDRGWLRRRPHDRALLVTASGREALDELGVVAGLPRAACRGRALRRPAGPARARPARA